MSPSFKTQIVCFFRCVLKSRKWRKKLLNTRNHQQDEIFRNCTCFSIEKLWKDFKTSFFVDYMLYFCNRRHENLRDLRISDYSTGTDDEGRRFIYMFLNHTTQNHKYDDIPGQCGRMKEQQLYPYNSIVRFRHRVSLRSLADIMHMVCRPRSHVIYV